MIAKILTPLDGSALAEQAIATAGMLASRTGASIDLLRVDTKRHHAPEHAAYIEALADEVSRMHGVDVTGLAVHGDPADTIVRYANGVDADLIAMSTHGHTGLRRALLGSVADKVVRTAGRPVLLQRPVRHHCWRTMVTAPFERILVPLDRTQGSATVLGAVLDLCATLGARPILARVVHPVASIDYSASGGPDCLVTDEDATRHLANAAQDELVAIAADLESDERMRVETTVAVGVDIGAALLEVARRSKSSLIAMATRSCGASRLFRGSVTDAVLQGTSLPLLLLHPDAVTDATTDVRLAAAR